MHPYLTRYTLRTGERGTLSVLASSSCAAILALIDAFGDQLKACTARPR